MKLLDENMASDSNELDHEWVFFLLEGHINIMLAILMFPALGACVW